MCPCLLSDAHSVRPNDITVNRRFAFSTITKAGDLLCLCEWSSPPTNKYFRQFSNGIFSGKELQASSTLMVAGVVLRYCATQPMTFEMPDSVYANNTLVGV